uniref:HTH psq-type domain-containing protein n=1 Tax=Homalodisca liturata TaxID=320908 RepID=A0A1B6HXC1_9HEMI
MVRNYIKKKVGPEINERDVEEAVKLVLEKNVPIRQAAESFGLVHTMLFYRIKKAKALLKTNLPSEHTDIRVPSAPAPLLTFNSKYTSNQVFSAQEEKMLEEYIITCSAMNYGLTYKIIRALAFQYAEKLMSKKMGR